MTKLRLNDVGDPVGSVNPITLALTTGSASWVSDPGLGTIASPDFALVIVAPNTPQMEIIKITSHVIGATTAICTRNFEATIGGQNSAAAHTSAPWVHGCTAADFGVGSTSICEVTVPVSSYHQAPQVLLQGTFVAPAADFTLTVQGSFLTQGGPYTGGSMFFAVGIPAGGGGSCGGIIGDEVGQITTGAGAFGTLLYYKQVGYNAGQYSASGFSRRVPIKGAVQGTTYTVQLLTGSLSGYDAVNTAVPTVVVTAQAALTPLKPDFQKDIWLALNNQALVQRFTIGARILSDYEGVLPRLIAQNTLATGNVPYGVAIDINGKMAVVNAGDKTVTIIDTTAASHAGTVLATSSVLTTGTLFVAASPDGTGFWVPMNNGQIVKLSPTTGAILTTINVHAATTWGGICVAPNSLTAYLINNTSGDVYSVPLASGASPAITTLGNLGGAYCIAMDPAGLFVLVGCAGGGASSGVYKITLAGPVVSAQAARRAVAVQFPIHQIAISADGKMYFAAGPDSQWWYGWTRDLAIYDGITTANAGSSPNFTAIVCTENDGVYRAQSGGSAPNAFVDGFPGATSSIDPTDVNNDGFQFADVILG